jgi:membrane protein
MLSLIRLTIDRARKERLAQIAGSLTLTTLLSVVPLVAVSFALFTRVPLFNRFNGVMDRYVLNGFLPPVISRTVLRYLNHFAANASGLTWIGSLLLPVTAVALFLTVENALNQIWQVKKSRPFLKRVGSYLLMLLVGPPVLALSLWATSTVIGASMGAMGPLPRALSFLLDLGPLLLSTAAVTGLFYYLPNAKVRVRDALVGGLIASVAFELGKRGFAAYLVKLPTYKAVYGAFAAFPLFVLWTYFSWIVTLLAALIAANMARGRKRPGK